jgi:predicted nucleotidyltransferase
MRMIHPVAGRQAQAKTRDRDGAARRIDPQKALELGMRRFLHRRDVFGFVARGKTGPTSYVDLIEDVQPESAWSS